MMPRSEKLTTTVSSKGQIILPKTIRQHRNWAPGTRLVVEETPDGVSSAWKTMNVTLPLVADSVSARLLKSTP
jgi:AbrB family looped-hinge helix DNA binding protein